MEILFVLSFSVFYSNCCSFLFFFYFFVFLLYTHILSVCSFNRNNSYRFVNKNSLSIFNVSLLYLFIVMSLCIVVFFLSYMSVRYHFLSHWVIPLDSWMLTELWKMASLLCNKPKNGALNQYSQNLWDFSLINNDHTCFLCCYNFGLLKAILKSIFTYPSIHPPFQEHAFLSDFLL